MVVLEEVSVGIRGVTMENPQERRKPPPPPPIDPLVRPRGLLSWYLEPSHAKVLGHQ